MNKIRCARLSCLTLIALLLTAWAPAGSLLAQTPGKTRTLYLDIEGKDHFELGRNYAGRAMDQINKRSHFLKAANPSEDCVRMLGRCQGIAVRALPRIYDEVAGIGGSLGIKFDNVFLMGLPLPLWDAAAFPGSAVVLGSKHTVDGKTWLALNVDHELDQASFGIVVRRRWPDHPTTLVWDLAGGIGVAGVNSSGLAIATVWLKIDGEGIVPAVPAELIVREALDQKDFDSAMAVLADPEIAPASVSSFAVIIADNRGHMALVERTHESFSAHSATEGWLIHTNHFLDQGFARDDLGKKMFPDTVARYKTLQNAVLARPKFSLDDIKALMANHDGKPNGVCRHGRQKTIASILMCPDDGTLIVTQGNPCMANWETFKLDSPAKSDD